MPALAKKVDLVVGIDTAFQMESQMEVQQSRRRTRTCGDAFFGEGFFPSGIGAEAGSAAEGSILALNLSVKNGLGSGIVTDFFIGQDGHETFLQGSKAALDFTFGLRAGSDQMSDTQSGEGALKLRTGITVISHGVMTKEAQAVGIHDHGQGVLDKEAAKMLEMIPSGVGGDKDRAQELAGMVIDGQQERLFFIGRPPLVNGGIVLPQFINA